MAVRKKWRDTILMGSVQVVTTGLRGVFRVWEWFAPPAKKQKLRAFREKMGAMERDKKQLLRSINGASAEETLALADAFEDRWDLMTGPHRAEIVAMRDASRESIRQTQEESAALQSILRARGNDSAEAINGLHDYIAAHPNSDLAYKYLGGVFCKRREWDESVAAYRQAEAVVIRFDTQQNITYDYSVAVARMSIGDVLNEKGDYEAAVAQYNFLLQNAPPDQSFPACYAYLKLGNVYQTMNLMQEARAAWKTAIKRDETGIVAKQARQKLKER